MNDPEISAVLSDAATQAADASHVLFVAAQLAAGIVRAEALSEAEALKVTAAAEAARLVAVAAVEDVLRRGRASALSLRAMSPTPQTHQDRIATGIGVMTLLFAVALIGMIGWWLLFPYKGMTRFILVSETTSVQAGGLYRWTASYCVGPPVPAAVSIERELSSDDGTRFPLPRLSYVVGQPCETFERSVEVPVGLPPGRYHLHVTTGVQVNPMRVVYQTFTGDHFEVVK
jgi:hypothetical protein